MAWIELHQALWTNKKLLVAAAQLDLKPTYLGAHLARLWCWALDNATEEGCLGSLPPAVVALVADYDGDAERFVAVLRAAGFFDQDPGGNLYLHDWTRYAHPYRRRGAPRPLLRPRNPMRRAWDAIAATVRPRVLERDGYCCVYCGATERLEVDHVIPIARGGTNEMENLQALCRACNRTKGAS